MVILKDILKLRRLTRALILMDAHKLLTQCFSIARKMMNIIIMEETEVSIL